MANTISDRSWRDKYRSTKLDHTLRTNLVSEKICTVDRSGSYRIQSPYTSSAATVAQALAGTYTAVDFQVTDDYLVVANEFIAANHIFDFQNVMNSFDLFETRTEQLMFDVSAKVDEFAVNNLCEDGTGTYTTAVGGFTTAAKVNQICADLLGLVAGYAEAYRGLFMVIENTEVPGFVLAQAGAASFSYADAALRNGFMTSHMGIDIHVVRSGIFKDATIGTKAFTNAGHRVFGVKGVATLAIPESKFEEKAVSGKTGMEIVAITYADIKLWESVKPLIVDITVTA
jgi:hypothetical protein